MDVMKIWIRKEKRCIHHEGVSTGNHRTDDEYFLERSMNVMDKEGAIVGSGDKERIGHVHKGCCSY